MNNPFDAGGELKAEVEIDYGQVRRGKYAAQVRLASNIVKLEPDVEAVFQTSDAVNEALRALIRASKVMSHEKS